MNSPDFSPSGARREFPAGVVPAGVEFRKGQVLWGDFRILGGDRGGMGVALFCRHEPSGRIVCLKTVREDLLQDKRIRDLFYEEIRIWFELGSHLNIVEALDCKHIGSRLFVMSEYVAGIPGVGASLAHHLRKYRPPLPLCTLFALQVCDAMIYATNKAAIVHRDLKPSNILVGRSLEVYLTDFGLARAKGGGTPEYMAPELFDRSRDAGAPASDVYALGVCLYQMIAGRLPFVAEGVWQDRREAYQRAHRQAPVPELPRELPDPLREAVYTCLQKDPARRYQGFHELKEALREVCRLQRWPSATPWDGYCSQGC